MGNMFNQTLSLSAVDGYCAEQDVAGIVDLFVSLEPTTASEFDSAAVWDAYGCHGSGRWWDRLTPVAGTQDAYGTVCEFRVAKYRKFKVNIDNIDTLAHTLYMHGIGNVTD